MIILPSCQSGTTPRKVRDDVGERGERTLVIFSFESKFGSQKCAVEPQGEAGYTWSMKLLLAFAVWVGMGTVLGVGILMAVKGSPWLLIAGLIGFVIAVGRIGCMSH